MGKFKLGTFENSGFSGEVVPQVILYTTNRDMHYLFTFFDCSRKRVQSFIVNIGRLKSKTRVILVKIYLRFVFEGKSYPRLIKLKWRDKLDWFIV